MYLLRNQEVLWMLDQTITLSYELGECGKMVMD